MKIKLSEIIQIVKESLNEEYNEKTYYMFFQNLKQIKSQVDSLLSMNETEIDEILKSGHDWASDHISTSKDDIEEVYNFLKHRKDKSKDIENEFIRENKDNNSIESVINLGNEIFEKYMYDLTKEEKKQIKDKWADDGLSRMSKFSGNNIRRISEMKPDRNKDLMISDLENQLEILKEFMSDSKIDELINKLVKI